MTTVMSSPGAMAKSTIWLMVVSPGTRSSLVAAQEAGLKGVKPPR